jgi:hypothetical protein
VWLLRLILRWLASCLTWRKEAITRRLGSLRLGSSAQDGDAPEAVDPFASLVTWKGSASSDAANLIRLSETGAVASDFVGVGDFNTPIARLGGAVLYIGDGGFLKIYRIDETGGTPTLYIDADADITAGPGYPFSLGFTRLKTMKVDAAGRLSLFFAESGGALYVYRWNADATFDQLFTLAFALNGIAPASHDEPPSAAGGNAGGLDLSPDGQYLYVVADRVDTGGDLGTSGYASNVTIYRFDLDDADPSGSAIAWAQYPYQHYAAPLPSISYQPSPYRGFTSRPYGIAVSPDGSTLAVEVKTNDHMTTSIINPLTGAYIEYSYLKNWLDTLDASGTVLSHSFLADDYLDLSYGEGGLSPFYYPCSFSQPTSTSYFPAMAWAADGVRVFYWLVQPQALDHAGPSGSARVANYASLFARATLAKYNVWDASTTYGSVESFANFTPYLLFASPGPGCTVGGHSGDIYAYQTVSSGGSFKGAVYRSDQSPALKEIIPVDGYASTRPVVESLKLSGGDLYLIYSKTPDATGYSLPSHPHPSIKKVAGAAGHAITVLYDWDGESHGDHGPYDMTFDSSGNRYVGVLGALQNGAAPFQPGGMALLLYKFNAAGVFQWRKVLPTGTGGWDCGFVWLANDDKTLLYSSFDSNGDPTDAGTWFSFFDQVKRYDLVADAPLSDLYRITSDSDTVGPPTAPYLTIRDAGRALLTTDSKLIVTVTSETTGHTILDSTQGYRGTGTPFLYQSGSKLGANYRDSGGALDADPDGVSVWFITGPHQPDASYGYLSRYNIATGVRTKGITLLDETGAAIIHQPFALCGGFGGHGNPPPPVTTATRVFGFVTQFV